MQRPCPTSLTVRERYVEERSQRSDVLFRFVCPDCGMSDRELGHLSAIDEIHCIVCLIDEDRHVRLRRWLAEEHAP